MNRCGWAGVLCCACVWGNEEYFRTLELLWVLWVQ